MRFLPPVLSKRSSSVPLSVAAVGKDLGHRRDVARAPWQAMCTLWRFARPHTIIGTTLSVAGLFAIALAFRTGGLEAGDLAPTDQRWAAALALGTTWLASLGANVAVVGLNQLYDVPIDRINKPYLPLVSGALSPRQAWAVVLAMAALALALAAWSGPILLATIGLCMVIGALYSLPPVRLKRFALPAALCIVAVRGLIVNPGIYLGFARMLEADRLEPHGLPMIPSAVWALTCFMIGLSLAIAIAKDMPDVEGDRRYAMNTLAVRLGARSVFKLSCAILVACYAGMVAVGVVGLAGVSSAGLIIAHAGLGVLVLRAARRVPPDDPAALTGFYRLMWRLFYAEYLVFPLACVL